MKTAHLESAFEAEIVAHLVAHGWIEGDRTGYSRKTGLDTAELFTFLGASRAEAWDALLARNAARTGRSSGSPTS